MTGFIVLISPHKLLCYNREADRLFSGDIQSYM